MTEIKKSSKKKKLSKNYSLTYYYINPLRRASKMDKDTNINDYVSHEFNEGLEAWSDMKTRFSNPYDKYSFEWVEWDQGWNEAAGNIK